MYQTANLQHKTDNKELFKVDVKPEAVSLSLATLVSITTTQHIYTDGTIATEALLYQGFTSSTFPVKNRLLSLVR